MRMHEHEPAGRHVRVAIIGAGFGGVGAAMRLKERGVEDFVVIERDEEIGGTWQVNTYPGAQCDIPSILYSFSFAPNPRWTRLYPLQEEIKDYLDACADDSGLRPHLRMGTEVVDARWDDAAQHWWIDTTDGVLTADILVAAMGPFSEPAVPRLPGLDTFEGDTYHSAQWNHDTSTLDGRRVAVIGTGASAVQFIPRIQPAAETLTVFQRTPTWIMPHPDRPLGPAVRRLFSTVPAAQRGTRALLNIAFETMTYGLVHRPKSMRLGAAIGRWHLRRQVDDPGLREALTPHYSFGCKRPTFSNAYYPALAAPNADVVTSGIERIDRDAIVTADGRRHPVDTIIFGTGFNITGNSAFSRLRGRDGRTLADQWSEDDQSTYLGTTIRNFPNMVMILGPNSVVYTSQVVTIESQVDHLLAALDVLEETGATSFEVRADTQADFVESTDRKLAGSVWNVGGCSSYYLSASGRNFTFWPGLNASFRRRMRRFDAADYRLRTVTPAYPGAAAAHAGKATVH